MLLTAPVVLALMLAVNDPEESRFTNGLIATAAAAQVVEWSLTMYGLGKESVTEQNPVWSWAGERPTLATVVKVGVTTAFTYALVKHRNKHPKLVRVCATAATIGFGAVAVHNHRQITRR